MRKILTFLFLAFFLSSAALAAENARHPELQKFKDEGGEVEFIGHAYGLDGWLLAKEGLPPRTVYTTPEGGMVLGVLVNPEGTVETTDQLVAFKAKADGSQAALPGADQTKASKSERFYAEVEKAAWAKVGAEDAPYIYMFMNVGCDHCQAFWKDLQPLIRGGKLQVRLLPFGTKENNRYGGAALLSAEDPGAAWLQFIGGKKEVLGQDRIKEGMLAGVDANSKLFKDWGLKGTPPVTLYRSLANGQVTAIVGRPDNAMLMMADLLK
jgi:hypothetical protein